MLKPQYHLRRCSSSAGQTAPEAPDGAESHYMKNLRPIPKDIREAIAAFLNACQMEARPFASAEALGAIRTMFPHLDISDADLEDAITSEAAEAGYDIDRGGGTVGRPALMPSDV